MATKTLIRPATSGSKTIAQTRRLAAQNLHRIESNPLDAADLAMFEMFDREGWSSDRRRAFVIDQARQKAATLAAK